MQDEAFIFIRGFYKNSWFEIIENCVLTYVTIQIVSLKKIMIYDKNYLICIPTNGCHEHNEEYKLKNCKAMSVRLYSF